MKKIYLKSYLKKILITKKIIIKNHFKYRKYYKENRRNK